MSRSARLWPSLSRAATSATVFLPHAPQPLRPDATYRYRHEPQDLLRAMAAMAERSERRLPPKLSNFQGIVGLEPYPVTKKADRPSSSC